MFEFETFEDLKNRSVLMYMTDLKVKNNEKVGHYGQTLISINRADIILINLL